MVLIGDAKWRHATINQALTALAQHHPNLSGLEVIQPNEAPAFEHTEAVTTKTLPHKLGQETDFVIFSGEQGLDANALGQAGGMIRAGGICWLSLPADWCALPNPANARFLSYPLTLEDSLKGFNRFFWDGLQTHAEQQEVLWVSQDSTLPTLPSATPLANVSPDKPALQLTEDQQTTWEQIQSVAFGHRHRPLVLTADRGRGKSTLLGVAAIRLLQQGKQTIAITAARLDQTQALFQGAVQTLNQLIEEYSDTIRMIENQPGWVCFEMEVQQGNKLTTARKNLQFIAPDELAARTESYYDLLMVDEAAHLPLPLLMTLATQHNRLIFATTQQGYEGSGRGFTLRFLSTLKAHYPQTKTAKLHHPIRWADGDPLEKVFNQCLLFATLDDNPNETETSQINTGDLSYRAISVEELIVDRTKLSQLFQLLTFAHYQTAPNDLMQLLETPNQHLYIAEQEDKILGVLFALEEGNLPFENQGRKQGHLFPQLMQQQTANDAWLADKTLRIVRLAVQPDNQSQGIGTALLSHFINSVKQHSADINAITTSFGATPNLVDFWHQNGFTALHLGQKRDKASGTHSLLMALPLCHELSERVTAQHAAFIQQFAWLLTDSFQTLSVDLVLSVLAKASLPKSDFPEGYLTNQPFEAVSYPLRQWTLSNVDVLQKMEAPLRALWIKRVLQNPAWESLVKASGMTSRKQLEQQFKQYFNGHVE
ncbi:tRNA(Met) cytidine acetyltransferase TmcA [Hydrogenovibrio marinus]|nr:tRNA(Met) cytidine acetyltransferase TmcA [Hydrogenovibrio marinus]